MKKTQKIITAIAFSMFVVSAHAIVIAPRVSVPVRVSTPAPVRVDTPVAAPVRSVPAPTPVKTVSVPIQQVNHETMVSRPSVPKVPKTTPIVIASPTYHPIVGIHDRCSEEKKKKKECN